MDLHVLCARMGFPSSNPLGISLHPSHSHLSEAKDAISNLLLGSRVPLQKSLHAAHVHLRKIRLRPSRLNQPDRIIQLPPQRAQNARRGPRLAAWQTRPSGACPADAGVGWGLPHTGEPTGQPRGFADRRPRTPRRRRWGRLRACVGALRMSRGSEVASIGAAVRHRCVFVAVAEPQLGGVS